jgi:hypothetical protein
VRIVIPVQCFCTRLIDRCESDHPRAAKDVQDKLIEYKEDLDHAFRGVKDNGD